MSIERITITPPETIFVEPERQDSWGRSPFHERRFLEKPTQAAAVTGHPVTLYVYKRVGTVVVSRSTTVSPLKVE